MKSNKFSTKESCDQLLEQIVDEIISKYGPHTGATQLEVTTEYLEDDPDNVGCVCARITIEHKAGAACYVLDDEGIHFELSEMESDYGSNALILDFLSKAQRVHYMIDNLVRS